MQVRQSTRIELQSSYEKSLLGFNITRDNSFIIACHVRRTDKLAYEAKKVDASVFASAIKKIINSTADLRNVNKNRIEIIIISDDIKVPMEFNTEFSSHAELCELPRHYRISTIRPDRGKNDLVSSAAYTATLLDLRIMIESDVFLGSQTS